MFRSASSVVLVLLSALACIPQQAASSAQRSDQSEVHATIPARLTKFLDSKKLKPGDEVVAKTAVALQGNGVTIPSGSRVIGHVTQAQARSKGDPTSSLGIVFDKIELTSDKQFPIQGFIQAVAPTAAPNVGAVGGGIYDNKGAPGKAAPYSTVGGAQDNNSDSSSDEGLPQPKPLLNADSHGIIGIPHLELDKDSVLVSTDKELKLESGTQLLIRTFGQPSAQVK